MSEELLAELINAIRQQSVAIQSLADSNMALIAEMARMDEQEPEAPNTYMDGTPCR